MASSDNEEMFDNEESVIPSSSICPENVNKDILPLVFPASVTKSSKDPNRGLYPKKRLRNDSSFYERKFDGSSVSFTKASDMYKSSLSNAATLPENRLNKPFASNSFILPTSDRLNKKLDVKRLNYTFSKPSSLSSIDCHNSDFMTDSCSSVTSSSHGSSGVEPKKKRMKKKHLESEEVSKNTLFSYYTKHETSSRDAGQDIYLLEDSAVMNTSTAAASFKKFPTFSFDLVHDTTDNLEQYDTNYESKREATKNIQQCDVNNSSDDEEIESADHSVNSQLKLSYANNEMACEFVKSSVRISLSPNDPCCSKDIASTSYNLTNSAAGCSNSGSNENFKTENFVNVKLETPSDPETKDKAYHFGLFGASDKCNEEILGTNYFSNLPDEMVEPILRQIPFLDLMKLCTVCRKWNEIISHPKFLEWRKTYYDVKAERYQSECWHKTLPYFNTDSISVKTCFSTLLRFMTSDSIRKPPPDLEIFFLRYPNCVNAKRLLEERFPEQPHMWENSWCILCITVLFSETVNDIYKILRRLKQEFPFQYEDVLETMFCIATILLYFIRTFSISHGPHYRLYNAIYLLENELPANSALCSVKPETGPGQQSLYSYCEPVMSRMTYEQIRILNHRLRPNQRVKVIAFAGTGKTSTLIQFARIYSNLKFLNVMFNKAVCEYASSHFPSNVVCKTAHSLAYQAVGKWYRHKLNFKLKPHDIMSLLKKPEHCSMHIYSFSKCVLATIDSFCQSADEYITIAHVPTSFSKVPNRLGNNVALQIIIISDSERLMIAHEAEKLWGRMISKDDKECRITHDVYLKMFQLSHPVIPNYDCIMIDEAQDCNGAMLDIMLSQRVPVILVGDPNQQIYGFRGATNSLQSVRATHTYHLTKSFRFGPEIAYLASCCLEVLKHNTKSTLIGELKESHVDGTVKGQYAVIARTNDKLFIEAIRLCCTTERKSFEPQNFNGAFAGGIASYGLDQFIDICKLQMEAPRNEIHDKFIRKFDTFYELRMYAFAADDKNMITKIELVTRYGSLIIKYVNEIKQKCSHDLELADVVFTTAHKSKGLEFDTVSLCNDFQIGSFPRGPTHSDSQLSEEYNILYVALTRAKKCLVICERLHLMLLEAQENFEYPVLTSTIYNNSVNLTCVVCSDTFAPHTVFTLVRRNSIMASGRRVADGPLCMKCATYPYITPEVHSGPAVMLLDLIEDRFHASFTDFLGPLPSDEPIVHPSPIRPMEGERLFIFRIPRLQ